MSQILDPQLVNFAKAIRQTESGGNPVAVGKSGEYGAYQFTEPTWNAQSKKFGVDVALKNATIQQQNEVAYKQLAEWKKQNPSWNVGNFASAWNAGQGESDAYKGTFSNGKPSIGTNKFGVRFDVPAYAKSVATAYQAIKAGGNPGVDQNNPSAATQPAQPQQPQNQYSGILGTNPNDSLYGNIIDNSITRGIQSLFPGKQVGQAIGTAAGYALSPNKDQYDLSAPSPLQVAGDIAQGAVMVGTGMPEGTAGVSVFGKTVPVLKTAETALGRIGQSAAVGAGFGATGALANGETNVGKIAGDAALGGVVGGGLGTIGEGISALFSKLPVKMMDQTFKTPIGEIKKGLKTGENSFSQQVLDHGIIGTNKSIYLDAIDKVTQNENALQNVLKTYDNAAARNGLVKEGEAQIGSITKSDIVPYFRGIVTKYQNTPGMADDVKMVQKVFDELPNSLTLSAANEIKRNLYQELGNPAYRLDANLSTKREAMKTLARGLKDMIEKKTGAGTQANSVVNHFNRELAFYGKLRDRALTNMAKGTSFGMKDFSILGLGELMGGHPLALGAEAAKKAYGTTIAKTALAQGIKKAGSIGDTGIGGAAKYVAKTAGKIAAGKVSQ